jgi:citrate lyase synthetase
MKFDLLFEKIIKDYSAENSNTKAIFVFGRMNPPTAGHELVINHANEIAEKENRQLFVFVSKTQDNNKNPLDVDEKLRLLDFVFPNIIFVNESWVKNPFDAGYWLRDHGFKNVKLVAGSDRKKDYEEKFKKYNDHADEKLAFQFKRFKVESVGGERDPDSDDTSGISASKARKLADDNNLEGFMQVLPADSPADIGQELFDKIRDVHGIANDQQTGLQ